MMVEEFKSTLKKLFLPILVSSVLYTIGPVISGAIIPPYLYQSRLYTSSLLFRYAISFDGIIFAQNKYQWEQSYAFLPGYTTILHIVSTVISFVGISSTGIIIVSIVLNKILNIINCVLIVKISSSVLSQKASKLAGILFLFNPSAIFNHSLYSEPLFTFLSLIGVLNSIEKSSQNPALTLKYIISNFIGLCAFSISTLVRTTGIFYCFIYSVPIISKLYIKVKQKKLSQILNIVITGIITLTFFLLPFVSYIYFGYLQFCRKDIHSNFCDKTIPNIYSYVQQKFWDVGFLKYYYKGQQMQCIFGLTTIFFLISTFSFSIYKTLPLKGLLISILPIVFTIVLYANVQSGTRFIATHPLFYINIASFLIQRAHQINWKKKILILYFAIFNGFGMIFFPARFSWA